MDEYGKFLSKKLVTAGMSGIDVDERDLHSDLFDFQRHCVKFALRAGSAALFLGTGLGKTFCQLEFCHHASMNDGRPALILTPLAVAWQIAAEGTSRGYDCRVIRSQNDVRPGINVANYDRLKDLDPGAFSCISLDESSILKAMTGKTARALISSFKETPFRCAATATPAPNDHMELGNHAAFLGVMSPLEMLSRWFINDASTASQSWRLKGHAEADFWAWVASWARMAQSPDDLGFDGAAFVLPPLNVHRHRVRSIAKSDGSLFGAAVSATGMFEAKRQTMVARVDAASEIVNASNEQWIAWCDTDAESRALSRRILDAVEVTGSMHPDVKEENLKAFGDGAARVLVTKPKIAGFGLNFQRCHKMAFVGRTFSYEAFFQAVRRCWRFGQKMPVDVHLITDGAEDQISSVLDRKAEQHAKMCSAMSKHMRKCASESAAAGRLAAYEPNHNAGVPKWLNV